MLQKQRFLIALTVLVIAGVACSIGQPVMVKATPSSAQNPSSTSAPSPNLSPASSPSPASIPSKPIGLRQGLSSLDSYRLTIKLINNGPTAQDKSQNTFTIESGTDGKSSHTKYETIASSADSPEAETSVIDQYMIGNKNCTFSEGDSEANTSDLDPMMKDVLNSWYSMFDLVPMVNEPVFIGAEEVNGVMTNHFKFKVNGLGIDSGAEVVSSEGEYWLAQDGQYIVKYSVVIETRNGPAGDANTKIMHSEFFIQLQDINQPINIAFSQICNTATTTIPASSNQGTQEPSVNPNSTPASKAGGFAGLWDSNYGDLTCAIDGEKVNCTYTHNAGKIEGFLDPGGKSMEGSWFEAPTYQPADHAGRLVLTLSDDGNSFTGQWWYGPAGDGGFWKGTRK